MSIKGIKEAVSAVAAAIAIGIVIALVTWMLTGCAGGEVYAKYSHRSSIPDYYDTNTSDTLGGCVAVNLCKTCGDYAPEMHGCINYELDRDKPVYGNDPSGEIAIHVPVKKW